MALSESDVQEPVRVESGAARALGEVQGGEEFAAQGQAIVRPSWMARSSPGWNGPCALLRGHSRLPPCRDAGVPVFGGLFSAMSISDPGWGSGGGELVLTTFNTSEVAGPSFAAYLEGLGSSPVTVRTYSRLAGAWMERLEDGGKRQTPAALWLGWDAPPQIKRLTGYACRAYVRFAREVLRRDIDLGVPARLPAASRPRPHAPGDGALRALRLAAKRSLPTETGHTMRVWISLVDALGLRRSETDVSWREIDLGRAEITVTGKTGARTLPLSARMVRVLRWLRRRHPATPWVGARGQRLGPATLYELFKGLARGIGMGGLRPHLLRHRRLTAICRTELGRDPLRVLRFSGQGHVGSLQYYYDVPTDDLRDFVETPRAGARGGA